MLNRFLTLFVLLASLSAFAPDAQAERRVALVIGNSSYLHAGSLRNPRNDAGDMAETLKQLGFEVTLGLDLDQQQFAKTIDQFARQLDDASVGLLYYAGHGLQINEKNYLVSVNARLESEFLVSSETIELNAIIALMEAKVPTNLVFLDACRNNPLSDRLRQNLAATKRSASLGRGLARVEPTGRDTLIAFAAAPGQEAADGRDRNSPFTAALLKYLPRPGVEVSVMLKEVAAEVRRLTRNEQRPQQLSDMSRTFYFAKAEPAATVKSDAVALAAVTQPAAAPRQPTLAPAPMFAPAMDERSLDLTFWNSVQASNDCESTRAYLSRFPNGIFIELARLAERRLCVPAREVTVLDAPASSPIAAAPPPPPLPETAKPETVVAALPTAAAPGVVAPSTATSVPELTRNIQLELIRLGCAWGGADGKWSSSTRDAIGRVNKNTKARLDANAPSAVTLAALRKHSDRACPLECKRGYQARGNTCVAVKEPESRKSSKSSSKSSKAASSSSRASERNVEQRRQAPKRKVVEEEPKPAPLLTPGIGVLTIGPPIGILGIGRRR